MVQTRVCVTGGAGFIGSNLCKRLKEEGKYFVVIADVARNSYFAEEEICDEFLQLDLRSYENCKFATAGCDWVFHLASNMGGMGFIHGNNTEIMLDNTIMDMNVFRASADNKVKKFLYTSSACVYPEYYQLSATQAKQGLKEGDVWPAKPQEGYGLEKLYIEELLQYYSVEADKSSTLKLGTDKMQIRIARLHNIYGPRGTWKGGREKAPAAFCRKVLAATDQFEMWGDGNQTRSFCFISDCVDALMLLMNSQYEKPLNIGSEEMISMNEMAKLVMTFENKNLKIVNNMKGPTGVAGRNSNNDLVSKVLGWQPHVSLKDGLLATYNWISSQMVKETNVASLQTSKIL